MEEVASCSKGIHDAASLPDVRCGCGLHAFYSFEEWQTDEDNYLAVDDSFDATKKAVGIVSASGRAIFGEYGYRAERARVEAIVAYKTEADFWGVRFSLSPALEALAARYGVPLIEPDEIDVFCQMEGLAQVQPMEGAESELRLTPGGVAHGWQVVSPAPPNPRNLGGMSVSINGLTYRMRPDGSAMDLVSPAPKPVAKQTMMPKPSTNLANGLRKVNASLDKLADSALASLASLPDVTKPKNKEPFYAPLHKKKGLNRPPR